MVICELAMLLVLIYKNERHFNEFMFKLWIICCCISVTLRHGVSNICTVCSTIVLANMKNITVPHHWPFVREFTSHRWILRHKEPVMPKAFQCHGAIMLNCLKIYFVDSLDNAPTSVYKTCHRIGTKPLAKPMTRNLSTIHYTTTTGNKLRHSWTLWVTFC